MYKKDLQVERLQSGLQINKTNYNSLAGYNVQVDASTPKRLSLNFDL